MPWKNLSPAETILLILGVFYVAECFVWLPIRGVLFAPLPGRRARQRGTLPGLQNDRGGVAFTGLFPFTGFATCTQWPASVDAEADAPGPAARSLRAALKLSD